VGTSGAYGGSGSKNWKNAQDSVAGLPDGKTPTETQVAQAVKQIAQALTRQNTLRKDPPGTRYTPEALLHRAGVASTGSRMSGGRILSGSNTARGLAAVGAGLAYSQSSQAGLDELGCGLRLDEMKDLSARDRCKYILDKVLGEPGSPDEEIVRTAAYDALKDILISGKDAPDDAIAAFMAEFVFQSALVELTSAKAAKRLTPQKIRQQEKNIRQWIAKKVKYKGVIGGAGLSVRGLMQRANEFRDGALALLRGAS
jgi:hypothetical protein